MPSVAWLSLAPVKGLGLVHPDEVFLGWRGVAENRRFYLVDDEGRRYGQIRNGLLVQIKPHYDPRGERLRLDFPDGTVADGDVAVREEIVTDFYGRPVRGRLVEGPWNEALSVFAGAPLRLVQSVEEGAAVDRSRGTVSIASQESLEELASRSGAEAVDGRRFRMLIGVEGLEPHGEDAWVGREVRVGEARVRLVGHVGRCAITTQNPDTGRVDFDTLRELKAYRGLRDGREIDFGVFGEVVEPGPVRLGDPVDD